MVRFLASTVLAIIANAFGLIVAAAILDDVSLSASGFVIAVLLFTLVELLLQPYITQTAFTNASVLVGSSALVATLLALVVTTWVSDSLEIDGALTWVLATLIVWAAALLAAVILPMFLFKRVLQEARN